MNSNLTITHEALDNIIPHPENGRYFSDMTGEAWEAFLEDVKEYGITEPLTIDETTRYIIKGNQRYRAARILQMETVPCIIRPYEDENDALDDLIRDNAMRRDMGLLDKYKLVGHLKTRLEDRRKKNGDGGGENKGGSDVIRPRDQICQLLGMHRQDVTAALAIESLSPSEKQEFFEWVNKANPSKKNMYQQIKILKGKTKELEEEKKGLKKELKEQKNRLKDLEHLEEKRLEINKHKDALDTWIEAEPEVFAGAKYFDQGMNYIDNVLEIMTENLAFLKDMPMGKDAALALKEPMKQVIAGLDEYRDALFQKFVAITEEE